MGLIFLLMLARVESLDLRLFFFLTGEAAMEEWLSLSIVCVDIVSVS